MSKSLPGSPSGDPSPIHAKVYPQGTLHVPSTLLAIVHRFEKLQKWTIGRFRALEDKMNHVERWLVDKEKETMKPAGFP
jgi:hypothetical protein